MTEKLTPHADTATDETPLDAVIEHLTRSEKRSHWIIVIGAPTWVRKIIHLMHVARITEVRDWSRLTPIRNSGQVISLIQRPGAESPENR